MIRKPARRTNEIAAEPVDRQGKLLRLRLSPSRVLEFEPHRVASLFSIGAIITLCALGPFMSFKPAPFTGEGSPARQVAYLFVLAIVLYGAEPVRRIRQMAVLPLTLTLTLCWCWISLFWSIEVDIAIRRLMLTTIIAIALFLAVDKAGYRKSMQVIRICMVMILIANFIAVLGWPALGIHQPGEVGDEALIGNWRGVMVQKNFAGAMCAFTILAFLFDAREVRRSIRVAVIVGATFFLAKSMSKTSMGISVLSIICGLSFVLYRPRYRLLLVPLFTIAFVVAGALIYLYWSDIIAPYYSRDALTGRVQIWPAMIAYAQEHLLLGAGYGSFWNIGYAKSPMFQYTTGWVLKYASQGHNGYLDLLVTIGIPGVILTVLATLVAPITRILASMSISRQSGALLVSFIIFAAGHNMTESSLMDRDTIVQVFLILALALSQVDLKRPRSHKLTALAAGTKTHLGLTLVNAKSGR